MCFLRLYGIFQHNIFLCARSVTNLITNNIHLCHGVAILQSFRKTLHFDHALSLNLWPWRFALKSQALRITDEAVWIPFSQERETGARVSISWLESHTCCKHKSKRKLDNLFVKHGCPRQQQSQNTAKISKSYILTLPDPQGHVMSVKCEEPIDELTVQVCTVWITQTLNIALCKRDRITDRQTDGPKIRLLDAPCRPFRPGT